MPRVIAYDLFRLFIGPIFETPRGIDRVDLALARHVFQDGTGPNLGILPTPWGVRAFPARTVQRWLRYWQSLWSEDVDVPQDAQLQQLIDRLGSVGALGPRDAGVRPLPAVHSMPLSRKVRRTLGCLHATGFPLGKPARKAVPRGAVYLNIGQLGLAVPLFHKWLDARTDITCAMMLHDAIPLEAPHLVPPAAEAHHARMIRTAAHRADCLIFNSAFTKDSVCKAMDRLAEVRLPGLVRALPLPPAFENVSASLPELADIHYFVVVSTIEPRKNHGLLIGIWERLIKRLGSEAPHLIIVGSRGHDAGRILAPLEDYPHLQQHIHVVSGLSSPALAALVLGASAMLCPSFTEGFGLPVLEATALGVPTLASDIPAHRELGHASTVFLPYDDDGAWEEAVLAVRPVGLRARPLISHDLTEAAYCADVVDYVQKFY